MLSHLKGAIICNLIRMKEMQRKREEERKNRSEIVSTQSE